MHLQHWTSRSPYDTFSDAAHNSMCQASAPVRAEHDEGYLLVYCSLQNAFEGMAHQYTQFYGMVRNLGGEKRLQRRVGLLTEINDHVLCGLRRQRWSALWMQGV